MKGAAGKAYAVANNETAEAERIRVQLVKMVEGL